MNVSCKNCIKLLVFFVFCTVAQYTSAGNNTVNADPVQIFQNPPQSAKPGALWMWMGANLSKEGITRDLEALKKAGFNRTTMFSLADVTTPWSGEIKNSPTPEIISWTEPWWKLVRHAAEESRRLGMDFGMFNGPGYESSGGTWITPELSMQEICWSATNVTGKSQVSVNLKRPQVNPRSNKRWPVYNPETNLVEIVELANHPFFIGVQYHPEYKSTVANPQPIFVSFVAAMVKNKLK